LLTLLNLTSALIVSVKSPTPGEWTLRVGSSSSGSGGESSLRVTGLSPLDFSLGFSPGAPAEHLRDTEPRPIDGQSLLHTCIVSTAAIGLSASHTRHLTPTQTILTILTVFYRSFCAKTQPFATVNKRTENDVEC